MRRRSLVAVLLLSGCSQSAPTPPPPPPPASIEVIELAGGPDEPMADATAPRAEAPDAASPEALERTWSIRSADGHAEVRQHPLDEGKARRCQSTSTVISPEDARQVVWEWRTCIATREQFKFVSRDGRRVLVIDPRPALLQRDWLGVEVAALYEHGVRIRVMKAESVGGTPRVVREPLPHLLWLAGLEGPPGNAPRYSSDGDAVEFQALDGRAWRLGFSGEGFPASEALSLFNADEGLLRYEDARGTVHFVRSLEEVPERYRSRAGPVTAQVDIRASPKREAPAPPKADTQDVQVPNPVELVRKARETAKQVEEIRREQDRLLNAPP
ncbi:hypothetical protein [Melittangium boletus]|uniref:Lipoprotein n=1 Tax=Melittangium boletus DSM 14713 TaxID=1294270 RepID=A0A250IKN0_9BACT|nr:hypothetical protein [Melittangium boletus]ATB31792.1 hypothetical protein MEBOL_005261 [Melittangium boletus DSM 14713]